MQSKGITPETVKSDIDNKGAKIDSIKIWSGYCSHRIEYWVVFPEGGRYQITQSIERKVNKLVRDDQNTVNQ